MKFEVEGTAGKIELEANDIEDAIRKYKDLNRSAEIEKVQKTSQW